MCPHGFDPTSKMQNEKKIRLQIVHTPSGVKPTGHLVLNFHGHAVEIESNGQELTDEACTNIFKRFRNLGDLVCLFIFIRLYTKLESIWSNEEIELYQDSS